MLPGNRSTVQCLVQRIRCADAVLMAALTDWLGQVQTAETLAEALDRRQDLPPGALLVTRGGDVLTRSSVTFFAPRQERAWFARAPARN
jgi:chromosome segregation protein